MYVTRMQQETISKKEKKPDYQQESGYGYLNLSATVQNRTDIQGKTGTKNRNKKPNKQYEKPNAF
jgi:hypothetical protein